MKRIIITIVGLWIFTGSLAQDLNGLYSFQGDSVQVEGGTMSFIVTSEHPLVGKMRGKGTLNQIGKFIILTTEEHHIKTTVRVQKNGSNKLLIEPCDGALIKINIHYFNSESKPIYNNEIEPGQPTLIDFTKGVYSVKVASYGYDVIEFKLKENNDYVVKLVKGSTIEKQLVVFKILSAEGSNLQLRLIDIKADKSETNDIKKLKRLEKKKRHFIPWENTLTKN